MDVETGFGIAPVSGPALSPVKSPLLYGFPFQTPSENPDMYKAVTTRLALTVSNRLAEDKEADYAGIIVDTPGNLNDPRSNYSLIAHLVSEFSINVVLTLGSERLYNDMQRRFGTGRNGAVNGSASDNQQVHVLRIATPAGAVEPDAAFLRAQRAHQIRSYFFGTATTSSHGGTSLTSSTTGDAVGNDGAVSSSTQAQQKETLNPHTHNIPFTSLNLYKAVASTPSTTTSGVSSTDNETEDPSFLSPASLHPVPADANVAPPPHFNIPSSPSVTRFLAPASHTPRQTTKQRCCATRLFAVLHG